MIIRIHENAIQTELVNLVVKRRNEDEKRIKYCKEINDKSKE